MRNRLLPLALVLLAPLAGCGGGGKITVGAPSDKPPAAEESPATEDTVDADGTGDTTASVPEMDDSGSGGSDSGSGGFPGTDLDKCMEVSEAFSGIAAQAGGMSESDATEAVEKMKSVLPDELADDIDVLIGGYSASPAEMGEKMTDQSFIDANQAITEYLTTICGGG